MVVLVIVAFSWRTSRVVLKLTHEQCSRDTRIRSAGVLSASLEFFKLSVSSVSMPNVGHCSPTSIIMKSTGMLWLPPIQSSVRTGVC